MFRQILRTSIPRLWLTGGLVAGGVIGGGLLRWVIHTEEVKTVRGNALPHGTGGEESIAGVRPTVSQVLAGSRKDRMFLAAEMLPRASVEELAELLAGVMEKDGSANRAVLRMIFARWVELNAEGMIRAVESKEAGWRYHLLRMAVTAWAERRGTEALEAVRKKWPSIARDAAMNALRANPDEAESLVPFLAGHIKYWENGSSLPPELAPDRIFRIASGMQDSALIAFAIQQMDPAAALSLARDLPEGELRRAALAGALRGLADSEPESFLREYENLEGDRMRSALAARYVEILAKEDLDAAAAWARRRPRGMERNEAMDAIAHKMISSGRNEEASKLILDIMMGTEGGYGWFTPGAEPFAAATPVDGSFPVTPEIPLSFIYGAFQDWFSHEPAAAAAWVSKIPDAGLRSEFAVNLVRNPATDLSLIPSSSTRLDFAAGLVQGPVPRFPPATQNSLMHGSDDPPGPLDLLSGTGLNDLPQEMQRPVALKLIELNGVPETEWEQASPEDRRYLSGAAIAGRAKNDPQAALDFFNAIPAEERSLEAWHEAGNAFMQSDPDAAAQWMVTLPRGTERDAAAAALVDYYTSGPLSARDGEVAFSWAAGMSGEVERGQFLEAAARTWAMKDPAAARAGVLAGSLTEQEKAVLLAKLPSGDSR